VVTVSPVGVVRCCRWLATPDWTIRPPESENYQPLSAFIHDTLGALESVFAEHG
jgi:hypothetical protein